MRNVKSLTMQALQQLSGHQTKIGKPIAGIRHRHRRFLCVEDVNINPRPAHIVGTGQSVEKQVFMQAAGICIERAGIGCHSLCTQHVPCRCLRANRRCVCMRCTVAQNLQ